jgi:hypothetical protein
MGREGGQRPAHRYSAVKRRKYTGRIISVLGANVLFHDVKAGG